MMTEKNNMMKAKMGEELYYHWRACRPGYLRAMFLDWIDQNYRDLENASDVEFEGHEYSCRWLVKMVRNCTDILPNTYCDLLNIPQGSTYAQASRGLKYQND